MLTVIICFINSFITMFGGEGFIKNYDMAFCAGMFELIITIGIIGIINFWRLLKDD